MKRLISFVVLSSLCLIGNAQDPNWSAEIHYPISVGASFPASEQGIIGAALKYRFAELGTARLGVALGVNWFGSTVINDSDPPIEENYRTFTLGARIFAEKPITKKERLHVLGGLGWSFNRSVSPAFFDENGRLQGEDWDTGPAINLGLSYKILKNWYLKTDYEIQFLSGDSPNKTVGLLKFGTGIRF